MKEWLCLNCQTQRALRGMEPPGHPKMEMSAHPNKVPVTQAPVSPSIQKKEASDLEKAGKKVDPPQKLQEQQNKAPNGSLPMQKVQQQDDAKSEAPGKSIKEESGFFGFGARSRSPSPQPAVAGKVLGFGSSFLSSASNLLSSAVQDDASNTPPTSRKGSTVSQTSNKTTPTPPTSRKGSAAPQDSKTPPTPRKDSTVSQSSQKNATPPTSRKSSAVPQTTNTAVGVLATSAEHTGDTKQPSAQKQEKKMSESPQLASAPSVRAKTDQAKDKSPLLIPKTCPLCKANISSDPPNFSTCMDCKNTVCNLCGFNPMPHQKEVRDYFVPFIAVKLLIALGFG